ncbi:E3 ubiquitin ligase BIG BROTHER-related-like [Phalaenopsis equestris]|uniref:E3 ubiquitin ligase BIG BROTHER-related-like n=1 Tax=Phalaenopsis equestris TaxID=78828 RepID=UPI0009E51906|nr:E3 ubiquitin ligase BIG BROTHER-related-like [Phalaenopsis equestris]
MTGFTTEFFQEVSGRPDRGYFSQSPPTILVGVISDCNSKQEGRSGGLPFPSAIMGVELQTGGKQKMDIYYVHAPAPHSVEENFEGYFQGHDELTIAQLLQEQETVYQSLQRNAQIDTTRSSNNTPGGGPAGRQQRHANVSQIENAESQLAMDEAFARELQELELHLSSTSIDGNYGTGTGITRAESSTASSRGNSARSATSQITIQDDVDPDNMTYEQLQSLGEAIGTKSRGLSDELISFLPFSTYRTGLFQKRENHQECLICSMAYKNRDKLINLPCQHQYHKDCITKWLKIKKACPVCNAEVFGP